MDEMKQADITTDTVSREQTPNNGYSAPDTVANGNEKESSATWQQRHGIDQSKHIRLVKLAHMRYQHPDLVEITTFLKDFGMQVTKKTDDQRWFRGYGMDQYVYYAQKGEKKFLGGAFEVESYAELEKAALIPGASKIEEMTDAPGGGHIITLIDPEGFPINLIYGQTLAPAGQKPESLLVNTEAEKPRVRKFQRFNPGPAAVHKLGHYGICVTNFNRQFEWYTHTFNFVPTDLLYVPDDSAAPAKAPANGADAPLPPSGTKVVATFCHIDRGQTPVDHHSFFMSGNPTSHVHHCSFEIHDLDTQHLGHAWLAQKGYKSVWGVGRHILGSQIFDYWWDTSGFMVEHYADGDLVTENTPVGYMLAGDEALAVWGPEVPKTFLE
ncbi:hypothetical protein EV356DRAFT_534846 [Viridothelium virens]|uniref:VOC domain-containing protein n=1 Tax=Viridothelium virens TaxID=1048519 RepID=A0A6A6H2B8_VIRVR|nr:hypothetical protein EV356DRAFT_534846 [Viridothelium virens]